MGVPQKHLIPLTVWLAGLGLISADSVTAQTFTVLHSFTATSTNSLVQYTNSDGANPYGGLVLSGNTLYGTAEAGGTNGFGTVFAVNIDGNSFTTLHNFTGGDGANPPVGLVLSGSTLYGTAYTGGDVNAGTVFAVNTDGSSFTRYHSFGGTDGGYPQAGLALSGNTLYGSTTTGAGSGTLFAIYTNGTSFGVFYTFSFVDSTGRNFDGASPEGRLIVMDNGTVFGTASTGGAGQGTVFGLDPGGTGWWQPFDFYGIGEYPKAGLALSSNTLYGTSSGPPYGVGGTIFAINTDGSNPRTLHGFTGGSDGGTPLGSLILLGNTLYGTTSAGGSSGNGTVFQINIDGSRFITLYSFSAVSGSPATNSDGANPRAELVLSGDIVYGTTSAGGSGGNGTIFALSVPPQLTIIPSSPNVFLTWPTNFSGYTLQSTTDLAPAAAWTTNSPSPVAIDGWYTVTNPMSAARQFFRLSQ
jgi:uncharacterized repeat protein (TIGR03803 family)